MRRNGRPGAHPRGREESRTENIRQRPCNVFTTPMFFYRKKEGGSGRRRRRRRHGPSVKPDDAIGLSLRLLLLNGFFFPLPENKTILTVRPTPSGRCLLATGRVLGRSCFTWTAGSRRCRGADSSNEKTDTKRTDAKSAITNASCYRGQ